jgi:hypothetical protein
MSYLSRRNEQNHRGTNLVYTVRQDKDETKLIKSLPEEIYDGYDFVYDRSVDWERSEKPSSAKFPLAQRRGFE